MRRHGTRIAAYVVTVAGWASRLSPEVPAPCRGSVTVGVPRKARETPINSPARYDSFSGKMVVG